MSINAMPQFIGNEKSEPPQGAKRQSYSMNDTLLLGNSFLKYLTEHDVKITLQRIAGGVVLTLQGDIGVLRTEHGAKLIPVENTTPQESSHE